MKEQDKLVFHQSQLDQMWAKLEKIHDDVEGFIDLVPPDELCEVSHAANIIGLCLTIAGAQIELNKAARESED